MLKFCCLTLLASLLGSTLFMCWKLDMFKSYEINDESCRIIDGPRGFEDQTYWNKDVIIST